MKKITKLWPWLAAICSGLLYALCFAPFNLTWFCWIALTPLVTVIWFSGTESRHRWLRSLLLGYVAGLTFFWIVFFWLTTVTVLGWFVLEFYMAIYFAIWAWFCDLLRPRASKRQSSATSKRGPILQYPFVNLNAISTIDTFAGAGNACQSTGQHAFLERSEEHTSELQSHS